MITLSIVVRSSVCGVWRATQWCDKLLVCCASLFPLIGSKCFTTVCSCVCVLCMCVCAAQWFPSSVLGLVCNDNAADHSRHGQGPQNDLKSMMMKVAMMMMMIGFFYNIFITHQSSGMSRIWCNWFPLIPFIFDNIWHTRNHKASQKMLPDGYKTKTKQQIKPQWVILN